MGCPLGNGAKGRGRSNDGIWSGHVGTIFRPRRERERAVSLLGRGEGSMLVGQYPPRRLSTKTPKHSQTPHNQPLDPDFLSPYSIDPYGIRVFTEHLLGNRAQPDIEGGQWYPVEVGRVDIPAVQWEGFQ